MAYYDDIKRAASIEIPWNELSGKNILVTGATGMICSSLVEVLMSHDGQDYHVYASGRDETKVNTVFANYVGSPYFHFLKYDVCRPLNCNLNFHIIIAGAGVSSPQLYATEPVSVMKSNFMGVDNLFTYGIEHGLEKLLYISSGEVYGEGDGRIFREDDSGYVNCSTLRACYPSVKRATETLCVAYGYQYGIDIRIARPCHIYGPNFNESDKRVYAQFLRNVLAGERIVMKSSGCQYRSWCYVVDCATALLFILLKGEKGESYNIADESSNLSIKQLAELIATLGKTDVVYDSPTEEENAGFNIVRQSILSTEKIRRIGWSPCSSIWHNFSTIIEHLKK